MHKVLMTEVFYFVRVLLLKYSWHWQFGIVWVSLMEYLGQKIVYFKWWNHGQAIMLCLSKSIKTCILKYELAFCNKKVSCSCKHVMPCKVKLLMSYFIHWKSMFMMHICHFVVMHAYLYTIDNLGALLAKVL